MDEAVDDAGEAGRGQHQATEIEALVGPEGLVQPAPRGDHGNDADRDVEPEDPLPGEALGDGATDERSDGDGKAADAAPGAERECAAFRRNGGGEDRQRQRNDEGTAHTLQSAGNDEHLDRRRHRCQSGADREDAKADDEHSPPAEAVAERSAGEEQDGEGEGVGVHDPLQLREAGVEIGTDDGEGGDDDEVVEHRHEEGGGRDDEGPADMLSGSLRAHKVVLSSEQSLSYRDKFDASGRHHSASSHQ